MVGLFILLWPIRVLSDTIFQVIGKSAKSKGVRLDLVRSLLKRSLLVGLCQRAASMSTVMVGVTWVCLLLSRLEGGTTSLGDSCFTSRPNSGEYWFVRADICSIRDLHKTQTYLGRGD
jgi:hypothetical protein